MKKVYKQFRWWLRDKIIGKKMRKKLKNSEFTIISNDCTGGTIYHDLRMKFLSPTINLYMNADDFIKFCENLKEYINKTIVEKKQHEFDFPVGMLGDITIFFVHYDTFEEAKLKWEERKKRINLENLYIYMNDRNNCTEKNIYNFDKLCYKNKVIFTNKCYPSINSAYYIKGFDKMKEVGIMTKFITPFSIKRHYDKFDWVKWLNGGVK